MMTVRLTLVALLLSLASACAVDVTGPDVGAPRTSESTDSTSWNGGTGSGG